jgi:calcium-dependent protein kinase
MQRCLGEGSFGKVFEGFENATREKVAIKKVDFKTLERDSYLERAIHDEIRILSKFRHENIVQLLEVLNSKRSLYIIMEYCGDGDLKKYLKARRALPEAEAHEVMRQIARGYQ